MPDQPIPLEGFRYGMLEENLDIILTGIERFDGPDLLTLVQTCSEFESTWDASQTIPEWEIRRKLEEMAKRLYRERNASALESIRDRIEGISVQILERETRTHT